MALDFTKAQDLVRQIIAASSGSGYGSTTTDTDRRSESEISDAILARDLIVCMTIAQTEGHGRRVDFKASPSTLSHLDALPSHLGPLISVVIGGKLATPWDEHEIEAERADVLGLPAVTDPHYCVRDGFIAHNGTSTATVNFATVTLTASPQAPAECLSTVVRGAVAEILAKDGNKTGAAQFYEQSFQRDLELIKQGHVAMPPLQVEGP